MLSRKTCVWLSAGAIAVATILSSCGGGGSSASGASTGGSSGVGSSTSSSSSITASSSSSVSVSASYSAQSAVVLLSYATSEQAPSISAPAVLSTGKLIVPTVQKTGNAWNLWVQEFDDKSTPVGTSISLQTANTSTFHQGLRKLFATSSGGFVEVQGGMSSDQLVAKTIPADESLTNSEYNIAVTGGSQFFAPLKNDSFVTIFNDGLVTPQNKFTIGGRIFNASTGIGGSMFFIPPDATTSHTGGSVAPLSTNGFVVSWCDQCYSDYLNPPFTIFVQTYNQIGQPQISPIAVASGSGAAQVGNAKVFGLANGEFGVMWNECHPTAADPNESKVRVQFFNANGAPATGVITVGPLSEDRSFTSLAVLSSGRIALLRTTVGSIDHDYLVDVIDASGTLVGTTIVAAPFSWDRQVSEGSITARPNGGMAIMWQENCTWVLYALHTELKANRPHLEAIEIVCPRVSLLRNVCLLVKLYI